MNIRYIETEAEVTQVAQWLFDEWGDSKPDLSAEKVAEAYRPRKGSPNVPLTIVALDDGLVGTASLVVSDMTVHEELTPWLACLYVRADCRERGLGEVLADRILAEAKRLGYTKCYLWTVKSEAYYAKRGWRTIHRETYRGEAAVIMETAL